MEIAGGEAKRKGLPGEALKALPVDVPGTVSGGEEPLSFTLAPPTDMPETCRKPLSWRDRLLAPANNARR